MRLRCLSGACRCRDGLLPLALREVAMFNLKILGIVVERLFELAAIVFVNFIEL